MKYNNTHQTIPQQKRAEINYEIIRSIDSGKNPLSAEMIYNTYTGIGGLHNLKAEDYANYNEFSKAKKEIEIGQFFTPHDICKQMVDIVKPDPMEMVLDMCCGSGNFFNHLPNLYNAYGFDIDTNALKVAKHLYPEANLSFCDILHYKPEERFDVVIGNPPFNLDFDDVPSQHFYCNKAYYVLNPGGLLIFIVPSSFLHSDFWDRSNVTRMNSQFSFIGQSRLPSDAFRSVGVQNFETKIMVFSRRSNSIESTSYKAEEFVSVEDLSNRVNKFRGIKHSKRLDLHREASFIAEDEFFSIEYKLKKYLYELKTHPHLKDKYGKALALVTKFKNQHPPEGCTKEEREVWEKNKLTGKRVLSILRKYIRNQYVVPRKEIALVKTSYGFKLKGYAPQMLSKVDHTYSSINDLVLNHTTLPGMPGGMTKKHKKQYQDAVRFIERKQKQFKLQNTPFDEMERDAVLDEYIETLSFINKKKQVCRFVDIQKYDMGLLYQKRYSLLNWQQGSGKTGVMFHYGKLLLQQKAVKNVVILAPALATNTTWRRFLQRNKAKFVIAKSWDALENIEEGTFVLLSISMAGKMKRGFSRFMKMRSNKVCLLFDESDNITNPSAKRTKYSLSIFRRAKYKMLGTGTSVRNNINELYSQLEMMYNNSVNMMCMCREVYYESRDDKAIFNKLNERFGRPFPARGGATLFKACFCPGKATVFGIEKLNQDIYNKDELWHLIQKTIITRSFREIAGDKYTVLNETVIPNEAEMAVYQKVMQEFHEICYSYFNNSGDARKESQLKILRQIQLLIKACSVPEYMEGYFGNLRPTKPKAILEGIDKVNGKVAVGCTTYDALNMYVDYISERFPDRPLFIVHGKMTIGKREKLIDKFEDTENGILVCTQQSLESSIDIPTCNEVFLESLQWNFPRMEQFYFRFIRFDSEEHTYVRLFTNENSIEQNLLALLLDKERLNDFVKNGEVTDENKMFEEYGISASLLEQLLQKTTDDKGNSFLTWGGQRITA